MFYPQKPFTITSFSFFGDFPTETFQNCYNFWLLQSNVQFNRYGTLDNKGNFKVFYMTDNVFEKIMEREDLFEMNEEKNWFQFMNLLEKKEVMFFWLNETMYFCSKWLKKKRKSRAGIIPALFCLWL